MAKAVIRHDPPGPYKNIYGRRRWGWGAGGKDHREVIIVNKSSVLLM